MKEKEKQQGKERYLGKKKEECEEEEGKGGAQQVVTKRGKENGKRRGKREGAKCVCVYWTWGIACMRRVASVPGDDEGLCDLATVRAISSAAV